MFLSKAPSLPYADQIALVRDNPVEVVDQGIDCPSPCSISRKTVNVALIMQVLWQIFCFHYTPLQLFLILFPFV